MDEIKRGQVPYRSSARPGAAPTTRTTQVRELGEHVESTEVRKKRPVLTQATAAAFQGNQLTGLSLDSRQDLPPFGFNPPPKEILGKRRSRLVRTYAAPPPIAQHASAANHIKWLLNPETRKAARLQRLIQVNPMVRTAFEKMAGSKVVLDGRVDGRMTLLQPGAQQIAVSTGAMTSDPTRDFYTMLGRLDKDVMDQAAKFAATVDSSSGAYDPSTVPPTFPRSSGIASSLGEGPKGLAAKDDENGDSSDEDEDQDSGPGTTDTSVGGITGTGGQSDFLPSNPATRSPNATSSDIEGQKVAQLVQRLNQMYSLISGMFSRYHQTATQGLANLK